MGPFENKPLAKTFHPVPPGSTLESVYQFEWAQVRYFLGFPNWISSPILWKDNVLRYCPSYPRTFQCKVYWSHLIALVSGAENCILLIVKAINDHVSRRAGHLLENSKVSIKIRAKLKVYVIVSFVLVKINILCLERITKS